MLRGRRGPGVSVHEQSGDTGDDTGGDNGHLARRRRHRLRWIGGSLVVLMLATATGAWIERRMIAAALLDRELARRDVAARYQVADIGLHTQRLTDVVIGNPARPDLIADWVELTTSLSLGGAAVTGIRAGRVRVAGRLVDGKLALGALDRLLPKASGRAAGLPMIAVDLADARLSIGTPMGVIGARLAGRGRLDHGFAGTLALGSAELAQGACAVARMSATLALRTRNGAPHFTGPVRAARVACAGLAAADAGAAITARLGAQFDRWSGKANVTLGVMRSAAGRAGGGSGTLDFAGGAERTAGAMNLNLSRVVSAPGRADRVILSGDYHAGRSGAGLDGRASFTGGRLAAARLAGLEGARDGASGTPAAPLVAAAITATRSASADFEGTAKVRLAIAGTGYRAIIAEGALKSASGARATFAGGEGIEIDESGVRLNTEFTLNGGGLPRARVRLVQARAGGAITARGTMAPYAVGTARLDVGAFQATFGAGAGSGRARVRLSGPVDGGRIDGLSAPLTARWNGRGIAFNPGCTPVRFDRVRVAALALAPAQMRLCADDDALARIDRRGLSGGARAAAITLAGALGESPLKVSIDRARYRLGSNDFTAEGARAALGEGDGLTVMEAASIDGRISAVGAQGRFADAAGHLATVPLRMSDAQGNWAFARGALSLSGAIQVADAEKDKRFNPLISSDMALTLADGGITASATLLSPGHAAPIVRVAIAHDLETATGHAALTVPDIVFSESFQPDRLTPLTYGVVAEVRGAVRGTGRIDWTRAGATGTGRFGTPGLDLDAAFGPVEGIATELTFTNLLNLETAPGQQATVARVNPGVAVERGVIRYQLLPEQHVRIEEGRWPFAGGALILAPSDLDLAVSAERRLTFRLEGVDAGQFLQQLDFKNLDATGVFDGVLPIMFNDKGGRIEAGELRVREGGGTIAYVGEVSQEDLGFWGNTAFQALKSLRYKSLAVAMNGALDGDMITEVRFTGLSQGQGAKSNFLVRRLQRLPFVFNVRIKAPFRQLFDLSDPGGYAQRALSQGIVAPKTDAEPVQPPESDAMAKETSK